MDITWYHQWRNLIDDSPLHEQNIDSTKLIYNRELGYDTKNISRFGFINKSSSCQFKTHTDFIQIRFNNNHNLTGPSILCDLTLNFVNSWFHICWTKEKLNSSTKTTQKEKLNFSTKTTRWYYGGYFKYSHQDHADWTQYSLVKLLHFSAFTFNLIYKPNK